MHIHKILYNKTFKIAPTCFDPKINFRDFSKEQCSSLKVNKCDFSKEQCSSLKMIKCDFSKEHCSSLKMILGSKHVEAILNVLM